MMDEVPDDEQTGLLATRESCKQLLKIVATTGRFHSVYSNIVEFPDQE